MKNWFLLVFLTLIAILSGAQAQTAGSTNSMWQDVSEPQAAARLSTTQRAVAKREIVPTAYRTLNLDRPTMETLLKTAPAEASKPVAEGLEIQLPLPEGGFGRFHAVESPIMEPGLAAKYPEIKTYVIQGIDDPTATGRIDMTYRGLRASIQSVKGRFFIDPYWNNNDSIVMSYYTRNFTDLEKLKQLTCGVKGSTIDLTSLKARAAIAQRPTGASLRTYRLALAADYQYCVAVTSSSTPTRAQVLAAVTTSINRVTSVYEREFAIRLTLVANTDQLFFITAATSPYTDDDGAAMLDQNQTKTDAVIGTANYDIGHVFSTGGGGIAGLGVVCLAGQKANGVTGSPSPVGDAYDIDYVAHEMGHQFGGNHTFNGTTGSASGNANISTAYEPGSGSTIMAYAGICSPQDLQLHSDPYFHSINYTEIDTYTTTSPGNGATSTNFPAAIATGNSAPVITAPASYTIPELTPFALTASATDANGDTLTYCWEELDHGSAVRSPTTTPLDNGTCPLFRSYNPTTSPTRFFPSLTYILNNANVPPVNYTPSGDTVKVTGEVLPTTVRTMNFRVSVRDNRANGGGQNWAAATVTTATSTGFKISTPNTATTLTAGTPFNVTWAVASTSASPISCANVKISYSTDGGNTFPTVLLASTANNGTASVTIPNVSTNATTTGRIKVEAVGNIFFDINDTNFTVTANSAAPTVTGFTPTSGVQQTSVVITGTDFSSAAAVRFNGVNATSFTINSNTQITALVPATGSTGPISVTNPIGTGTSSANFTFVAGPAAPRITSFSPTNGIAGASVVVTGTDFSNVTLFSFNGANASYTVNSSTQITAIVPSGATSGPLSVTTNSGTSTSTGNYTILSGNGVPVITSATTATGSINTAITAYQIAASNIPTSYSASNLPGGITVNASGVISGTPTVSGTVLSTISATNTYGTGSATLTFTITPASSATTAFSEDFASLTTGDNTTTGGSNTAWTGNTNFPTATIVKAYQAGGAVKLGTSSLIGSIISKTLDLSVNGGVFSVKFDVKGWTTVEGPIKVTVTGLTAQTVSYTATSASAFETKTLNFTGGTANSTLKIETTVKRAYIDNVSIVYGGAAGPGVTLTGTGTGLTANQGSAGTPSSALAVAGTNLTADITVTAPTGFEISKTSASGYATSLTYAQTSGTVASSPLYVRITSNASLGNVSGILSATSSTAISQIAVSGTVTAPVSPTFASAFPGYAATDSVGGVPALIAYALNGSTAGSNTAILPQSSLVGGVLQITFLARTNDTHLTISVEGNTDLANTWTATATKLSGVSQTGVPTGFERQTWSLTATDKGYLRVKVVQTP